MQQRKAVVSKIMATIRKVNATGLDLNEDNLIHEIMLTYGSARKKAEEYIQEAKSLLDYEHSKEGKEVRMEDPGSVPSEGLPSDKVSSIENTD